MQIKLTQLAPFIFVWLWSTGFVGAKYGLPYIEPFFMLLIRFIIVIGIFFLLINFYKTRWLNATHCLQQIIVGTLIHGGYLGGVFFAIKEGVPAGVTAIIVGLQPIIASILGKLFLNQTINKTQLIGLISGFVGVGFVIFERINFNIQDMSIAGLTACFVALLSIASGTILQKKLATQVPLLTGSFYQYIGAVLVVAILTWRLETQHVIYSYELFFAMTWLVLALSVFAILLLLFMIREGEVLKVSSYFYLVPPTTVIQTWLLFDESLGPIAIFGVLMTVAGVILVVKSDGARLKSA